MSVSYEQFLTKDKLDNYEDASKFTKDWVPRIEEYRAKLKAAIPSEYMVELPKPIEDLMAAQFNAVAYLYDEKLLSAEDLAITDTSSSGLVDQIAASKLTSVRVFEAFARRAVLAHQFTSCISDLFLDEGLARAKFLDEYLSKNGKTIGPLHGLPISLKEQMNYRGKITHAGYVSKLVNVVEDHGVTPKVLENLGAVFYARTTQPQTMMHLDSNNNITGPTRNPFNLSLSPGGSSSGEGSIVSFGGSSIGVGSDIGGLIRGPAGFLGCHGLRPTTKRISTAGGVSSGSGQESVLAVAGPMARLIEDIELWMRSYINDGKPHELDGTLVVLPWRSIDPPKLNTLTIAVVYDDGLVRVTPPIKRGLDFTVAKLKAAGTNVVEFKPIKTELVMETVNKMYNCDGNSMQRILLSTSGEPLTKLTKWALNYGEGSKMLSVFENRALNLIRDTLRTEYTQFLVQNKIDFVLSPTYNNVAPQPEAVYNWSYTALWNLLDFPTLTFQTGLFQDPTTDVWHDGDYKFRSELEELENSGYTPDQFVGAPIGLQLSGRRYFDEEVVAAGRSITELLEVDLYKRQ